MGTRGGGVCLWLEMFSLPPPLPLQPSLRRSPLPWRPHRMRGLHPAEWSVPCGRRAQRGAPVQAWGPGRLPEDGVGTGMGSSEEQWEGCAGQGERHRRSLE